MSFSSEVIVWTHIHSHGTDCSSWTTKVLNNKNMFFMSRMQTATRYEPASTGDRCMNHTIL